MSRPLNPNAQSFQPSDFLPVQPSDFLPVLPQYPHPHPRPLHVPEAPSFYHHQFPPKQQICYGFPPPPPTKMISDYSHQSMMIMTLNLLKDCSTIGGTGYFLKSSSSNGRGRRCSKKLQLPSPLPPSPPPPPPPPPHHRRQIRSSTSSFGSTAQKKQWQRKVLVNGVSASAPANGGGGVPKPPPFSSEQVQRFGKKTSVMIKNIPSRYCRDMLVDLLVDHCKKENAKVIKSEEDLKKSAFDFVYLPIDFETDCNKGYAFVNFTNPNGVWRLYEFLNNYEWDVFNSKKICEVAYARIQGKGSLIRHFSRSTFACEKDEYLPVYFNPFLDGSDQVNAVEVVTVGTRSVPSPSSQQLSILRRGDDHHIHQQVQRNHDEDEKYGEEDHP